MFTPTLRCECAQPASDRLMRKWCIHFLNPYDKTKNLTLFSEKSEHVLISDLCGTLKVNGGHLGNATICGISEKCCYAFIKLCAKSHSFNILCTMDGLSSPGPGGGTDLERGYGDVRP